MKKVTKALAILTFTFFLGLSTPVMAQNDNTTRTESTTTHDDNDHNNWGLAGLLGLLGLLGLRKRDNDRRVHTTTTNRRD